MLRLSKRVEYGIIAMRHMAVKNYGDVTTAKEVSERYDIPYELLAKVLQRLAKKGLIISHQGVHGGYTLVRDAADIPLSTIISAIEENVPAIVQCVAESPEACSIWNTCTIKSPLVKIQSGIDQMFNKMTLQEIV
ncbi:MAG: RrF2 family transcriptional regulator [Bacteroidota bacterium]